MTAHVASLPAWLAAAGGGGVLSAGQPPSRGNLASGVRTADDAPIPVGAVPVVFPVAAAGRNPRVDNESRPVTFTRGGGRLRAGRRASYRDGTASRLGGSLGARRLSARCRLRRGPQRRREDPAHRLQLDRRRRRPMSDVTWFGGAYLAMTAFSLLWNLGRVGDYREPLTFGEVFCQAIVAVLVIWGLFTVGVTS